MSRTTIGRLLIDEALPPDLRRADRVLDKKGINALFQELADKHPEKYRDVAHKLTQLGGDFAYSKGGLTFGVRHLRPAKAALAMRQQMQQQLDRILDDSSLNDKEKEERIIKMVGSRSKELEDAVFDESLKEDNPLALQILSGVRGNRMNLRSLRGGDLLYVDHRDRVIPMPVLRSYSEGLSPAEYWAGAFGARRGVVDVKRGVADAGYAGKVVSQTVHRLIVTAHDHEKDHVGPLRGMPVDADDPDNVGALLGHDAGGFKRNTVITPKVLKALGDQGIKKIVVRSPIAGGPPEGGVYARDVGIREKGGLPPIGDYVGIAAGHAISEKLGQGMLCLAWGTRVRMADGTIKSIQEIQVGDLVFGVDIDPYGTPAFRPVKVLNTFFNGKKQCYRYYFHSSVRTTGSQYRLWLDATPDHKILSERLQFGTAGDIGVAMRPVGYDEDAEVLYATAFFRLRSTGEDAVGMFARDTGVIDLGMLSTYDIEVDHPDHTFLLANGLIVSNSSKHTGGVAGANAASSGFKAIANLISPPKVYPGAASHAQRDGRVDRISEAPQGGWHVSVAGVQHYVPADQPPTVKVGDAVEAGDVLSEGVPNPAEIVKHKGIGEGRRYFTDTFRKVYANSGMQANRRNIELLARGLVDHVRLTEEHGGYVPDDVVPYSSLERDWEPRPGTSKSAPRSSIGRYIESPVLHYTIGTRITPRVAAELDQFGVKEVDAHRDPPPFHPEMQRGVSALQHDPEWAVRHLGSGLTKSTLHAAQRGSVTDTAGTSFVGGLLDPTTFGRRGLTQGWKPGGLLEQDALLDD